jgi:dTDP-4-amino-4,6-dideoxygalactose transaminase
MVASQRLNFLPFSPPAISEEEIEAVVETMRSGWVTTGSKSHQFEAEFSQYIGAEKALALNSCTSGLHLALATLEIGPGDEVISTPMTFCSSINVIEHVGATPILVDIEPDTLNIDPTQVAAAITPRTRAIMPVHYSGHPVDMKPILELSRAHGLYVIEDAAHSLPAYYEGRAVGTMGDLTSFSFYATKNLTTVEGGMLTGAAELIERARVLSLHGMSRDAWKRYSAAGSWYYEVVAAGFKCNMTDIQAAIGLVQLKRLDEMQARRRYVVQRYNQAFAAMPELQTPVERPNVQHAWHLYALRLNLDQLSIDRARFIEELKTRNIGTSVHFIPIHYHPYYKDKYEWQPEDLPIAHREFQRMLSLPLHPLLSDEDIDDVIAAVGDVMVRFRK